MDLFTAILFTTTFRGQGVSETVTKLTDISECRLVLNKRAASLIGIDVVYVDNIDAKSFRYMSGSKDLAYQNLQCIDLARSKE